MLNDTNLDRADLNLLTLFEAVLAEKHVGRAAERLNLTPSAVSHGLGRLRQLLNDPLFLKTPRGVVPTERANALAEPIADILARVRRVIATAAPFDPRTSARRFTIGVPDGTAAVLLPLLTEIRSAAPRIDLGIRYLQDNAAIAELDARVYDIAVVPAGDVPVRYVSKTVFDEEMVIMSRAGHPFTQSPTLDNYCNMLHVVVTSTGNPHSYLDDALARQGRARRVILTVPSFLLALSVIAETDMIAIAPKSSVKIDGARFGVVGTKPPFPLPRFQLQAIAPHVALMDAGLEWLFGLLGRAPSPALPAHAAPRMQI